MPVVEEIRQATCEEVARFGRAMYEAGVVDECEHLLDYFEAPWKWGAEYRLWTALGRPGEDDPGYDGWVELSLRGEEAIRLWLFEHEPDAPLS